METEDKILSGGIVTVKTETKEMTIVSHGGILVCKSQFDKYGSQFLRTINGSPYAEIIIVSDEKLKSMSASEQGAFLADSLTPGI